MEIYVYPRSRSLRATWTAEELGLDYQCHYVDVMTNTKTIPSKTQKVPTLIDGEITLFESSAICIYLAEKYGNGKLYPQNLAQKAIINQWIAFIITELEPHLWNMLKHSMLLPSEQRCAELIEISKNNYLTAVKIIAQELNNNHYLCHNEFSLADIFLTHTSKWALLMQLPIPENLALYANTIGNRPAFKQAMTQESESLKS